MSQHCKRLSVVIVLIAAALVAAPPAFAGDDWLPVSQDELRMTSEPKAPGAPAVYLFRQVDQDEFHGKFYHRIKVLTEEGRKHASVEILFEKDFESIHNLKARVIRPDGSIQNFDGNVLEKTVIKAREFRYQAKTFNLPDVQVGSIIEYRYVVDYRYNLQSRWTLSADLFTRRAKFSLHTPERYAVRWSVPAGLPIGTDPPKLDQHTFTMQIQDFPAFQTEDFMPPADRLRFGVDFIYYYETPENDQAKFWQEYGKALHHAFEEFANKRKAMEQAVNEIVSATDSPETKLQKIYSRVQKLRNTSYERQKTEQEEKREKEKSTNNVEDVWKRGGNSRQLNALFIALARAAGFEAYPVEVSARDRYMFDPKLMNPRKLNREVALVKVNGKDLFLVPGNPFAPFGLLPWSETGVQAMRFNKEGATWLETPLPDSSTSRIERKAVLALDPDGNLEGDVTVTFVGVEALTLRVEERHEDDTARKKLLEDTLKESIPVGCEVELTNKPDWTSPTQTLVAEYHVKVPSWMSAAGRRAFLVVGLFGSNEKHLFEHAERLYPVYFPYQYQKKDDITITLPTGWRLDSLPNPVNLDVAAVVYSQQAENRNGALHITRTLRSELIFVEKNKYDTLRQFLQSVRAGDEQQVVLLAAK